MINNLIQYTIKIIVFGGVVFMLILLAVRGITFFKKEYKKIK